MKTTNYVRDLDLWQYEMPQDTLTKKDRNQAKKFNVLVVNSYWDNKTVIVGTWTSLDMYATDYLGIELNADYLHPLYIGLADEDEEIVDGCDSDY